jgi:hypothetical protein
MRHPSRNSRLNRATSTFEPFSFLKKRAGKKWRGWGEEIFCPRALVAPPARRIEGGTEQKFPFPFLEDFSGARAKRNCKGNFCEVAAGAVAEAGGAASFVHEFLIKSVRAVS